MKRLLAFSMLFPMLILAGCKDADDGTSDIEVMVSASPTSIPLDNSAHVAGVALDTKFQSGTTALTGKWELTSNKTWVTFSTSANGSGATAILSGLGPSTVYFVIPENDEEGSRTADVFVNGATTPLVTITQDGTGTITISVTPTSIADLNGDAQAPCAETLTVNCLNEGGSPVSSGDWTIVSNASWLTLTLDPTGSEAATSLSGTGTKTVYLVVEENSGSPRTANITLNGGSTPAAAITQVTKIILPARPEPAADALDGIDGAGELPTASTSYVGAFWRASQIGERVIVTNAGTNTGEWTATVAWYDSKWNLAEGDGVVLAAGDSADPNIRHASNEPGDAESYTVSGTSASVTGNVAAANGTIVFRIGLTKAFTAYNATTNPARYAVVKLSYAGNTKHQLIFLRQGEGADYVMRPGDKDGNGNNVGDTDNRSYARKFTVYNLTASDAEWAAKPGGTTIEDFPQLAVNGGSYVQYPTQGGGTFQGQAKDAVAQRRVYTHIYNAAPSDWPTPYSGPELWSPSTDETCPAGYRRPQDGDPTVHGVAGSASTKGSEIRQSLSLNELTGVGTNTYDLSNSAWGYYADGFFDRRQIVNGSGASAGSASTVAATDRNAAYLGRIMFNPYSKASLFLPASGYRTTGNFSYAGSRSYYWMGSSFTATNLGAFYVSNSRASPYSQSRAYGWSIRCIQEP